jgi:hypothetical protein
MPYATVRANARTLPEATNRRAVLGALASVSALALPVGAMSAATPERPRPPAPTPHCSSCSTRCARRERPPMRC